MSAAAPLNASTAVPPERGRVISDCRDFTIRRLRDSLRGMLEKIEEDLVARAEAELDRDQRNLYMFTCGKARQQWAGIEQTFIDHLTRYFDARVRGDAIEKDGPATATSLDELSLVDEDELTQDLALHEITRKLKEHCDEELFGVEQRLGSLLGQAEPTDRDNPLGTEAIAQALRAACEEVDTSVQMRLVLLQSLESQISRELSKLYQDLNGRLVRHNVLPGLRRGFRRSAAAGGRGPLAGAGGVAQGALSAGAAQQSGGVGTAQQDYGFTSSVQGFGASSVQGFGEQSGFGPVGAVGPVGDVDGDVYAMLAQLVQGQMAAQGLPLPPLAGSGGAPSGIASPFVFEALSALQADTDLGAPASFGVPSNLLRDFRVSELGRHLGQFDAITVDIVAMLFDLIFDDAQIADPIKALVGRLQIPLVKVAMLDRSFFSSKAHPARRLLDLISHSMMRWGRDVGHDDPLYIKLAEIVDRILRDFERDMSLFEACHADLEAFVATLEAEETTRCEAAALIAADREQERMRRDDARRAADMDIDERLETPLPTVVQGLLDGIWRRLLRTLADRGPDAADDYRNALSTADELIWSVRPKADADERRSLVGALPGLLRRLNQGFDAADMHPADKLMLLNGLFDLHAQWIKPGLTPGLPPAVEQWVPGAESANDDVPAPEMISEHVEQDGLELEDISLSLPAGLDIEGQDRVAALKRGDWVEFRQADGSFARMRLNWVSPQRGIYLFTNPGSPRATSIAPDALALQLSRGDARVIDSAPMFDRAVSQALGQKAEAA